MPTWSWTEWGRTVILSSSPSQEIQACLSIGPSQSLINLVWENKPGHSRNKIFMQPIEYTGQFHTSMPLFCDSLVGNVLIQAKIPRKSSPKSATGPKNFTPPGTLSSKNSTSPSQKHVSTLVSNLASISAFPWRLIWLSSGERQRTIWELQGKHLHYGAQCYHPTLSPPQEWWLHHRQGNAIP